MRLTTTIATLTVLSLIANASGTVPVASKNSTWKGSIKSEMIQHKPPVGAPLDGVAFRTGQSEKARWSVKTSNDLSDGDVVVLRCVANAKTSVALSFTSGSGKFERVETLTPGEQFVMIPKGAFSRVDNPEGWKSVSEAAFTVSGKNRDVVLLDLTLTNKGKELPNDVLCVVNPVSVINPVGTAWPIYAVLDSSTYPKGVENAGKSLIKNLTELYGKTLPLNPKGVSPASSSRNVILVGADAAAKSGLVTEKRLAELGFNGFVVETENSCLAIAGESVQGTNYGVYKLLEKQGLKYFDRRCFTKKPVLADNLLAVNMADKPFFDGKRMTAPFCVYGDSSSRFALADPRIAGIDKEYPCDKTLWLDHTAAFLVPKKRYLKDHPEYYIQKANGETIKPDTPDVRLLLCQTSAGGVKVASERLLKWIEKQKDRKYFVVQQGDNMEQCQCETCRKKRDEEGWNESDLLLHWVNSVTREAAEKYSDKVFLCYAYVDTQPAPNKVKPADNVHVLYCPWPTKISAPDGFGDFDAPKNAIAGKQMRDWLKMAGDNLGDYDYNNGCALTLRGMSDRIKWCAKNGARGGFWYCGSNRTFPKLFVYVQSQLNWDPFQDERKLEREFIRAYYGAAAPIMEEIITSIYDRIEDLDCAGRIPPAEYFTQAFVDKTLKLFDQAIAAAPKKLKNEIRHDKLMFVTNGVHALKLAGMKDVPSERPRVFATVLKPFISLTLTDLKKKIERSGKEPVPENYQSLANTVWNLARVEIPLKPTGADAVPERLIKLAKDPLPVIRAHRVTKFDKPLPGGGVLIPALAFSGGVGPMYYKWKCEGKVATWVRGTMTEVSKMSADFDLDKVPSGKATLTIDGQDSEKSWCPPAPIRISINGEEIFNGPNGFVKCGWSKRTFPIPAGVLKVGENTLTIENLAGSDSRSAHWFMLSEAIVK